MEGRDDTPRNQHIAHRLLRARDWQDRPQFGLLCDWWRGGHGGVCALVGIGGAGKTAIADRFVRSLPGFLPTPDIDVDATLTPPRGLFVFSFYDAPNPDAFFRELATWLDDRDDAAVSYERTVRRLEKQTGVLLVLDGLEKVQDTGERSGYFGRLLDGRLRDLVLRSAEGWLPGVRLLITSRFQLFDALAERSARFQRILIEELTAEASVALLRQRGVRGPDHRLVDLARDQGFHALSMDLLGGYVARFLDGDPAHLTPDVVVPEAGAGVDPQVAALRAQERRFARLAERYGEALRESDPAALALLQRVCLFRLGVGAATLASIFTGEGKDDVAGPELARLDETGLEAKLALLVEMKLLERDEDERYNVHPAVRDGFRKTLDEEMARLGHDAVREGLEVSLGDQPGRNLSDPATLDLLEEIVYHTLAAGLVEEAWHVYLNRIGRYQNLLWRLGAYERGERICRAFARGYPPAEAPPPEGLSEQRQAVFLNEWALYLSELGRLDSAVCCYERYIESSLHREDWKNASIGNQNLTEVLVLVGRLKVASDFAKETLGLAERVDDAWERCQSYAARAHVRALRGETPGAQDDFRDALHWQHEAEKEHDPPLYSKRGVWHALLRARLGQNEEATHLTEANKEICGKFFGDENSDCIKILLADLARERDDHDAARQLLDAAHEWAITRDAKEPLCWAALVRARLEPSPEDTRRALEDGLRIARDCGFGIYHVDLLLERARLALDEGAADAALADITTALFDGVRPPEESGLPELLAATAPECGYAWGEAEGRHLRAEALLHRAAQRLGRGDFAPARFGELPKDVCGLVDDARQELETCRRLREKIQDPKVAETEDILAQLDGGVLTSRLLEPARVTSGAGDTESDEMTEEPSVPQPDIEGPIDVGVIVALEEEFEELHEQLPSPRPIKDNATGTYDYLFTCPIEGAELCRCAATFIGEMGPTEAALAAERFLERRRPRAIVMLGIAAGIHDDVRLGDVVVAKSVGRYLDRAKVIDGSGETFEIRPGGDAFLCSRDLVKSAQNLRFAHGPIFEKWQQDGHEDLAKAVPKWETLREKGWLTATPALLAGPIASGPVVAAAKSFVDWVRSMNRNYLGLEMEGGGVLAAVYSRAEPSRSLVLRGISDFGDARKKKLDAIGAGGLRRYAMRNAVRLLWSLMEAGELPRVERQRSIRGSRLAPD